MNWISREVRALMDKHCTSNPFDLAACLGYNLIPFDFYKIRGMFLVIDDDTYIAYSTKLPRRLQGLVVYHEIAHRLLHSGNYFMLLENTCFHQGRLERQANRFVAELVLSERRPLPGETIYEFADRYQVPVELVQEVAASYAVAAKE